MDAQVLTQIERWYHRGEFGRVVYMCDNLLQNPQYAGKKAELLYWKGNAHQRAGRAWHGEAISCFREGIACAGRDRPFKARLIASLGMLYSAAGDCTAYEKLIEEFERTARDRDPKVLRSGVWVWFNWGVVLDNAFRWEEASGAYSRAAHLAGEFQDDTMRGFALHNLGGVQLAMGRIAEAAATMAVAESLMDDEFAGHKKLSRRAEYYLAAGDLVSAQQAITAALVHPMVDDMTRADVYLTWAQTLAALRRPQEALEKALIALDFGAKAVHYPGIHKTNEFLQQLAVRT